ncbi:MAG: hypothetical protein ABDI07_10715 [Candidatus Kryptonium sp.]
MKCEIPEVPKPNYIKPSKDDKHYDLLRILLHNYSECRKHEQNLLKAIEVCK